MQRFFLMNIRENIDAGKKVFSTTFKNTNEFCVIEYMPFTKQWSSVRGGKPFTISLSDATI